MSDRKSKIRGVYVVTVRRQKGKPIRPAYLHMVQVEPHPVVTFEGTCRVVKSDFDKETWAEIMRRHDLGILHVVPYVEPKSTEPDEALSSAADEVRKAIDAGEMSDPFPDTQTVKPPPPLLRVHNPIKADKPDWDEARKEMIEQLDRPAPVGHDALTGEASNGSPGDQEPEPPATEPEKKPASKPKPKAKAKAKAKKAKPKGKRGK